ncbi:YcaO-like family protein [Pseudomonas sp. NPDC087817]|uniref:YcaO-like family protein n=1 Tax=Pseudomonas sp. NPDC087817 TaxID=3364451 RepID=UPI0037FFD4BC
MFSERESAGEERVATFLRVISEEAGLSVNYYESGANVAAVELKDERGRVAAAGAGKGRARTVGALAEALEHYSFAHKVEPLRRVPVRQLLAQEATRNDGYLQSLGDSSHQDDSVQCLRFYRINQRNHCILVPASLVSLAYLGQEGAGGEQRNAGPDAHLLKYFTNSGVATGYGWRESVLYGLNEVIERDGLSSIYEQLVAGRRPDLAEVHPHWLAAHFQDNAELLGFVSSARVFFGEHKGMPFAMALSKAYHEGRLALIGSGCSISPTQAVYRAVTELLQVSKLQDDVTRREDERVKAHLLSGRGLHRLIELADWLAGPFPLLDSLHASGGLSVAQQLSWVVRRLREHGFAAYFRPIKVFSDRVVVTQVYVPGLERFNLVRSGLRVVPQRILFAAAQCRGAKEEANHV